MTQEYIDAERAVAEQVDVGEVLYERKIKCKNFAGEADREESVWLREMTEDDVRARTRILTEQKIARKKGRQQDVEFHAERIRIFDFSRSIEHWELTREKRDEMGNIIWAVPPEFHLNPDGSIKKSSKSGIPLIKNLDKVEAVREMRPLNPEGIRTLPQYQGDQINQEIQDINDIPDPDEDDEKKAKKDIDPGGESIGSQRAYEEALRESSGEEEALVGDPI